MKHGGKTKQHLGLWALQALLLFPIFPFSLLSSFLLTFSLQLLFNDPLSFLNESTCCSKGKASPNSIASCMPSPVSTHTQPVKVRQLRGAQATDTGTQQEHASPRLTMEKHSLLRTRRRPRGPRLPRPDALRARSGVNRSLPASGWQYARPTPTLQPAPPAPKSQVTQLHRRFAAKTAQQLSDWQETPVLLQERQLCHRGNGSAC